MAELILDQVHYQYSRARKETLCGVDAVFPAGKLTSIVGQSGAGKSTLLYLISGLDTPKSGRVLLDGRELEAKDLDTYRRSTVATISQSYLLFPTRTALENVLYPMQLAGMGKEEAIAEAREHLLAVGIQKEQHGRLPSKLSGGEQQRVAIARCLAAHSSIIAADEPTGNLDEENAREVMRILIGLAHGQGKTVIIVTHDRVLSEQTDCRYRLEYGKLIEIRGNQSAND